METHQPQVYMVNCPRLDLDELVAMKEWAVSNLSSGHNRLLFDFSEVEVFDSAFIGVLHVLYMEVQYRQGSIALAGMNVRMLRAMRMFKMDGLIPCYDTFQEGLRIMAAAPTLDNQTV